MKIDYKKIRIPNNYVLVLPDQEHDKFHLNGKEVLPVGKVDLEHAASHLSVRGKVFAVPEELRFHGEQIKLVKIPEAPTLDWEQTMFYFKSHYMEMDSLKGASVLFDVSMDVRVGDMVYFNYQEHYNAYEFGRYIPTELGDMFLIKYDNLICAESSIEEEGLIMLNGYTFVEPISVETVFGQNIMKKAGLQIAVMGDQDMNIKKKLNIGYMRHWGRHCRAFINHPENRESGYDFKDGQVVMYNPKVAPPVEFSLHRSDFQGKSLVKLWRRDIFAILPLEMTAGLIEDLVATLNMN